MNRSQAFLVVGANPFEDRHGRTFYDDSRYYLLDRATKTDYNYPAYASSRRATYDTSRYFQQDFLDVTGMKELARRYPQKFDYIFFDFSVCKFFEGNIRTLQQFMLMLKDGGKLMMDDFVVYSSVPYIKYGVKTSFKTKTNYAEHRFDTIQRALDATRDEIRALPFVRSVELARYASILNPDLTDPFIEAARPIYTGFFVENGWIFPDSQFFLITKKLTEDMLENYRRVATLNTKQQTKLGVFRKGGRRTRRRKTSSA